MGKVNTTAEDVRASVSSIYASLLDKRRVEREAREEQKRMEAELKRQKKEEKKEKEKEHPMTKKEKRQAEMDAWKEIVIGLTGDDLEYSSKKKSKKKKYRKWISDDTGNSVLDAKPKKAKKKNYNKEFEPELNMLRTLVAEQNRFTADLQRRFQNAAGPATKDATPPNKTLVELASVISSGRTNSLGMLREIGSIKKTIADLYMKQIKLDSELTGNAMGESADLGIMGSNIAANMFANNSFMDTPVTAAPLVAESSVNGVSTQAAPVQQTPVVQPQAFDPSSWEGPDLGDNYAKYEAIPHTYAVEKNQTTGAMRFIAIRNDNGQELVGCNVPTSDPTRLKINEKDMTVRGEFDEVYKLIYV